MTTTQLIEHEEITTGLQQYNGPELSTAAMVLDSAMIDSMMRVAEIMTSGKSTIPAHLRGNSGDCLAVVMQSMQWKMNPFAVAQKTHLVNGTLGYEAQLVNAVIQSSGSIEGRFHYEYQGEGANVQCRVGAVIRGETDITWGEWLSASSVTTKNSPLWKTNPKQQLGYLQVKNWSRAFCPGAILGVYTPEELVDSPKEVDITPAGEYQEPEKPASRTAALKSKLAAKPATDTNPRNPDLLAEVVELIAQASNGKDLHAAKAKASELVHPQDTAEAMQVYQARTAYLQGLVTTKDDLIARVKSANTDDDLALLGDEARQLPDVLADEVYAAIKDRREVL